MNIILYYCTVAYVVSLDAFLQGFVVGAGLIIAIGPQNAFVLSQGLKKEHVLLTATICALTDALLIGTGVIGLGSIFGLHPLLTEIARWFGAIFLVGYGLFSLKSAFDPKVLKTENLNQKPIKTKRIVLTLLALGLLNPHAYLDTVVLIGSIAAQHPDNSRYLFGFGAISASVFWFFSIAYGARLLTPLFKKVLAWRILDILIGIIMLSVATSLILFF